MRTRVSQFDAERETPPQRRPTGRLGVLNAKVVFPFSYFYNNRKGYIETDARLFSNILTSPASLIFVMYRTYKRHIALQISSESPRYVTLSPSVIASA